MHIGLGIHVLVADLDGDKITALRPQVERAITDVQQLSDLFRVKLDFFRFTLYRCFLFFLLRHNSALDD